MRDSRLRALFVLALMLVACQSGERAKTAATKLATVDAGVAPPHVDAAPPAPTIVMEELPAPMPHAEMVTDLPSGRVLASGRRELSDAVIAGAYVYFASASDG